MMNVYRMHSDDLPHPVTIFARTNAEVFGIFYVWLLHHSPEKGNIDAWIEPLYHTELTQNPQLLAAALGEKIGVGWWAGHRDGWKIADAVDAPLGAVAPPETDVHCYLVKGQGFKKQFLFAKSPQEALTMFDRLCCDPDNSPVEFNGMTRISPWLLEHERITLREQMYEGLTGVARNCDDGYWRIMPVETEAAFHRRN